MSLRFDRAMTRRRFVQFLAASPLLIGVDAPALAQSIPAPSRLPDPMVWAPRELSNLIADPKEALDVFDFEPVARKNVQPAHFGYMVTGIDDEVTLRANREGFLKFQLRPRRLVDVGTIDMTIEIFGANYDGPIVIAPIGSNRAFTRTDRWRSPMRRGLAITSRCSGDRYAAVRWLSTIEGSYVGTLEDLKELLALGRPARSRRSRLRRGRQTKRARRSAT